MGLKKDLSIVQVLLIVLTKNNLISNYARIAWTSGGPEMEPNTDKCGTPLKQQPLATLDWTSLAWTSFYL